MTDAFPRSRTAALLTVVIALVLSLALAEVLTRVFVPDPEFRPENRIAMWQPDPVVGYTNKPNFRDYAWGFIPVETNQKGCRGREFSESKPAGTFRILGLGDSITWGVGVRDEDTYLRVLERRLNQSGSAVRFEAVNTGVVGYSTHQELLTLQHRGLALCPDLVILGFNSNDFYPTEDPFRNVHTFHQPPRQNVGRVPSPPSQRPWSYFYVFARRQFRRARILLRGRGAVVRSLTLFDDWAPDSFEARAWPVMQGHFRAMKRLADENGFTLLVLLFPSYGATKRLSRSPQPMMRVADFLTAEGIDFLDLFDPLRTDPDKMFKTETHPSALGHRVVAEAVLRHFEPEGGAGAPKVFQPRNCGSSPP